MPQPHNTKKIRINKTKHIFGFTLVELIVVITILAILATVAFLSFSGYSSSARDSVRLEDLSNLSKWLSLYQVQAGNFPLPEEKVDIKAGSVTIGYQGYASGKTLSLLSMNPSGGLDPLDSTLYTYAINDAQTKHQLLGYLENADTLGISLVSQTYANPTSYSGRTIVTKWDTLGIILRNSDRLPLQTFRWAYPSLDIASGSVSMGWRVQFTDSVTVINSGTLSPLISAVAAYQPKTLAQYDPNLVGYWDLTSVSRGLLQDRSRFKNDGTCYNSGNTIPCWSSGSGPQIIPGTGMSFDGQNDWIELQSRANLVWNSNMTWCIRYQSNNTWNGVPFWIEGAYRFNVTTGSSYFVAATVNNAWYTSGTTAGVSGLPTDGLNTLCFRYAGAKIDSFFNGNYTSSSSPNISGKINNGGSYLPRFWNGFAVGTQFYDGIIGKVLIYDRALSDSELAGLYEATK